MAERLNDQRAPSGDLTTAFLLQLSSWILKDKAVEAYAPEFEYERALTASNIEYTTAET